MAPKPKLVLTPSTSIPLDRLVSSNANVRKTNAAISIEALAASIARRGLLQSLSVRPVLDSEGNETGDYEVQAGSRRMRALKLLVKQKRLAKDAPIPCIVKTTGIAEDDSLAENIDREALHPLDQFRAFAALTEKGQTEEDIAAAFAVTPPVVRQRLKLAAASPKLLEAYAADKLNLEQLMAFCVTDDHARQEQVFDAITQRQVAAHAFNIRRLLTETCVEASDPRARFVGVDAYVAAGGTIMRDLFEEDDGGWLQDPDLLMRLVTEKLADERERILAQGWKWVEAAIKLPYELTFELRRLQPIDALSDDDRAHYDALAEEHDALIEGLSEDDIPDDVRTRLDSIEAELAELDNRAPKFAPEDMARAGVLVSVNQNGRLGIQYGWLRREDAPQEAGTFLDHTDEPDSPMDDGPYSGPNGPTEDRAEGDPDESHPANPLPDRLIQDLTSFRTVALREALGRDFDTAFLALLHAMCLEHFHHYAPHSCLQVKANSHFPANAAGLGETPAAKAIADRHEHWTARLPSDPRMLWDALVDLAHQNELAPLFSHCVSRTVNAVREPHQPRREALRHADRLAAAVSLDMVSAGWSTTADNYLARVTKAQILDAVREARGDDTARLIAHLKKGDMAKEAERLLQGTGWLPEPLRTPLLETASVPADGQPASAPALPDFLTEDVDRDEGVERLAAE